VEIKYYIALMIQNRKARHDYTLLKEYTAGIVLVGSEVKSLRAGDASIVDSFVYISNDEVFLKGAHIGRYKQLAHEEVRDRKLLLNRKEIRDLQKQVKEKGLTIIPLVVIEQAGKLKLKISVAQGKKTWDKKEALKEKDIKLQTKKELNQ
jgi:SsrA-binding protein